MEQFLTILKEELSQGQTRLLNQFFEDVKTGNIAADPDVIEALLSQVGTLLELQEGDITDPVQYNTVIASLLSNLAGLYKEIDGIESVQDAVLDLNDQELKRVEASTKEIVASLEALQRINFNDIPHDEVIFETFGPGTDFETDKFWFKPIPLVESSSQAEAFTEALR